MFQPREIGSISNRVELAEDPGDFPRLPGDDARQIGFRQREAFTWSHSSRAFNEPLNYGSMPIVNYGSLWPCLCSWLATCQRLSSPRRGRLRQVKGWM